MTGPSSPAFVVDEVGIEAVVYGDWRLRSAYQPIFARQGGSLLPVAVEGHTAVTRAGRTVPSSSLFDTLPAHDRALIDGMCWALHLRNYLNIGVDHLQLLFPCPDAGTEMGEALAEIRSMTDRLEEFGLDPALLVCSIGEAAAPDLGLLAELADELRKSGARIAIDCFGPMERVALAKPDVVRIDKTWFRALCREPAAAKLLASLVSDLSGQASVLVEGIENAGQLGHALDAGADLLQGHHLAGPAAVGTEFDESPLSIAAKLAEPPKVVRLFG